MQRSNWIASDMHFETVSSSDDSKTKLKNISDWINLFKEFNAKSEERCCYIQEDFKPKKTMTEIHYPTGAKYKGYYDVFGINGKGFYTFPDGVTYDGDFKDGMFHGKGRMKFLCGTIISGAWTHGLVYEPTIILEGELHLDDDCQYCCKPDRRFIIERYRLIEPAGKSYLTNKQPTRVIPHGYYDEGSGFYDPRVKNIVKYNDLVSVDRAPTLKEAQWIEDHCRVAPERNIGPASGLYEQFVEIKVNLYDESTDYGVSGLMDFHNPELEERLEISKKVLKPRLLPKTIQSSRRSTMKDFFNKSSRLLM